MEPMNLGSPPSSPATGISGVSASNFLPAFLIGSDQQTIANTSSMGVSPTPGRTKTPNMLLNRGGSGFGGTPGSFGTGTGPGGSHNLDQRHLRQKLFNQSLCDTSSMSSLQQNSSEKSTTGPPKLGLFDTLDEPSSILINQSTPCVTAYGNSALGYSDHEHTHQFGSDMDNSSYQQYPSSGHRRGTAPAQQERSASTDTEWVTVFGFPPSATSVVLGQLANCGTIVDKKHPSQGNWVHVRFSDVCEVARALRMNGKLISNGIMVGVTPHHDRAANKENVSAQDCFTSPISRARSLRMSYSQSAQENAVVGAPNGQGTPHKSTGIVTKAIEYVFGW